MAEETKKKNPSEMSDEEFLEYIASLGSDEDEVIDEGAEGEPGEVGEKAEDAADEASDKASDTAESEESGDVATQSEDVASDAESGSVGSDAAEVATNAPAAEGVANADTSGTAQQSGDADAVVNEWLSQEKALKRIVPNFSLQQAFANPQFKKLVVDDGMDIIDAYEQLNPKKAEETAVLDEIGRSSTGAANGSTGQDVESMSDEEFRRYIKRIEEEE